MWPAPFQPGLFQQHYDMDPRMMWGWGYHMGWLGLIMMGIFWIAVIIAIIFLIRWMILSAGRRGREFPGEESPLDILKKRYAKGEINKQEFEEKKKDLGY